jgi:O-antigen ligase
MTKPLMIIGAILVALLPWMSGGSDPLALLITVFALLVGAFLLWREPEQQRVASLPLRLLAFLWLGWGAASLIWSVNRYDSELWLLYAIVGVLVFAITAGLTLGEKAKLLSGYVWVAVAAALYGFYLYMTGDYGRLTSSFYWANPCAAYLLPAAFISGQHWLKDAERTSLRGWVRFAQVLVLGTAIWLTDSRGAILAAVIVLIGALASSRLRRSWLPLIGIIVLTFGLSFGGAALRTHFGSGATVTPGSRFAQAAEGESTSAQDRWNYLKSAISIWRDHPLLGIGAGTFGVVHPQYQLRVISASSDAHNIFAQTLAEQGLIGLLILIYLFIVIAVGVIRGCRREPQLAVVAAGAAVVLIHFGLDIDDRYPALIVLLAMLAGVCYQTWLPRITRSHAHRRWATPILLVVALVISISAYESSVWAGRGSTYDAMHQLTNAAAAYAKAHTGPVYDPTNWTSEGIDYYTLAEITGGSKTYTPLALNRAQAAITRDPQDSQNYFLLGRVERLAGNHATAEADYRQALHLDPWNHPDYYLDLASLLIQTGQTTAGQNVVSQGLALYPDTVIDNRSADPTIKPAVAELLALQAADRFQHNDLAAAVSDLNRALRLDPTNQDVRQLAAHGLHQ